MINRLFYFAAFLISLSSPVHAEIESDRDLNIEKMASELPVAWGMDFLSNEKLLISLRKGQLARLDLISHTVEFIHGLPKDIFVSGQGGLFDVALSPDYAQTGHIYFTYAKSIGDEAATTLAIAQLKDKTLIGWKDLLVTQSKSSKTVHFGGRITFDQDGHIFFSVGDRGHRPNAQDLTNHAGKILRLNLDGTIPNDNPFFELPSAQPEIWSYGHRNPQGLFYNVETHQLWEIEHGPRGGDEINLILAGKNYGWPTISYGKEYWAPIAVGKGTHQEGMEQPVKIYIPSIAPSSLIQYKGTLFNHWRGDLLAGALSLQHLNHLKLESSLTVSEEQRLLDTLAIRIRNVKESPTGQLFISTDQGDLYRISPKN